MVEHANNPYREGPKRPPSWAGVSTGGAFRWLMVFAIAGLVLPPLQHAAYTAASTMTDAALSLDVDFEEQMKAYRSVLTVLGLVFGSAFLVRQVAGMVGALRLREAPDHDVRRAGTVLAGALAFAALHTLVLIPLRALGMQQESPGTPWLDHVVLFAHTAAWWTAAGALVAVERRIAVVLRQPSNAPVAMLLAVSLLISAAIDVLFAVSRWPFETEYLAAIIWLAKGASIVSGLGFFLLVQRARRHVDTAVRQELAGETPPAADEPDGPIPAAERPKWREAADGISQVRGALIASIAAALLGVAFIASSASKQDMDALEGAISFSALVGILIQIFTIVGMVRFSNAPERTDVKDNVRLACVLASFGVLTNAYVLKLAGDVGSGRLSDAMDAAESLPIVDGMTSLMGGIALAIVVASIGRVARTLGNEHLAGKASTLFFALVVAVPAMGGIRYAATAMSTDSLLAMAVLALVGGIFLVVYLFHVLGEATRAMRRAAEGHGPDAT